MADNNITDEIKELQRIINSLNSQGKMFFYDGATKEQISDYEKKNNVILPSKFKLWLMFSDGGFCFLPAGIQLYGVSHKPVIDVKYDDRPDDSYVVIGAFASGDPILCKSDSNQISIYNHEAGRIEEDEIFEDFFAFMDSLYEILGIGE